METVEELKLHLDFYKSKALDILLNDQLPWFNTGNAHGARVFTLYHEEINHHKTIAVLDHSAERICNYLWDDSNKGIWDPNLISTRIIRKINENYKIVQEVHRIGNCISNRTFVYATRYEDEGDSINIISSSVDIEVPGRTYRGHIKYDFIKLKKLTPNTTELTRLKGYDLRLPIMNFYVSWWYGPTIMFPDRVNSNLSMSYYNEYMDIKMKHTKSQSNS